jgi:hypothetical protein
VDDKTFIRQGVVENEIYSAFQTIIHLGLHLPGYWFAQLNKLRIRQRLNCSPQRRCSKAVKFDKNVSLPVNSRQLTHGLETIRYYSDRSVQLSRPLFNLAPPNVDTPMLPWSIEVVLDVFSAHTRKRSK